MSFWRSEPIAGLSSNPHIHNIFRGTDLERCQCHGHSQPTPRTVSVLCARGASMSFGTVNSHRLTTVTAVTAVTAVTDGPAQLRSMAIGDCRFDPCLPAGVPKLTKLTEI